MSHKTNDKIILISHEFWPFHGGVATYTEEIALALHDVGCCVEVWAPDEGRKNSDCFPFWVERLPCHGTLGLLDLWKLRRCLQERKEKLRDAHILLTSVGALMSFMLMSITVSSRGIYALWHGSEILKFENSYFWKNRAKKFFGGQHKVAVASSFVRSLAKKSFLGELIPNFILAPCAPKMAAIRDSREIQISSNRLKILTLARIHPRKGQLDLVKAMAKLEPELKKTFSYILAGTGDEDYLCQIKSLCRRSDIDLICLGEVRDDQLSAVYKNCDIYALTSRHLRTSVEGFGISYLEASYHEKPILAYDSGGVSEAVLPNRTGILIPEGDLIGLTQNLRKLLLEPKLRESLGIEGRKHALHFGWQKTARILLRDLLGLIRS